ncbi:hypothetical protein L195_g056815 [Trifolium pratense]|nr:hypothetical protein L195_g056815 [Trifolium pratense]
MAVSFEVFFVFVFILNIPNREAGSGVAFFGLMVGNMVMASLMDAMIHWILIIFGAVIWVIAIFIFGWCYFAAEVKSGGGGGAGGLEDLFNRFNNEITALNNTVEEIGRNGAMGGGSLQG